MWIRYILNICSLLKEGFIHTFPQGMTYLLIFLVASFFPSRAVLGIETEAFSQNDIPTLFLFFTVQVVSLSCLERPNTCDLPASAS